MITIGFSQTEYTVSEAAHSQEVCVRDETANLNSADKRTVYLTYRIKRKESTGKSMRSYYHHCSSLVVVAYVVRAKPFLIGLPLTYVQNQLQIHTFKPPSF